MRRASSGKNRDSLTTLEDFGRPRNRVGIRGNVGRRERCGRSGLVPRRRRVVFHVLLLDVARECEVRHAPPRKRRAARDGRGQCNLRGTADRRRVFGHVLKQPDMAGVHRHVS